MFKTRRNNTRGIARSIAVAALLGLMTTGQASGQDDSVAATDYGTVTLSVQETDLAQVLEMLAIQTQKNIITSKNVAATISANLYDVTFYEALDAILVVNGYGYMERGNFIYVHTQEELAAIEAATRKTETRAFSVDYLSAEDAHEFIQPLLSGDGSSAFRGSVASGFAPSVGDGGADGYAWDVTLVVNDYPDNLDRIDELLGELDVAPQQVLVEATILQTQLDEANAFGIDFSAIGSINFTDLTNPLTAVGNLLTGNETGPDTPATSSDGFEPGDNRAFAATSSVGNTPGPGGMKVGVLRDDVAVFLRVLDEVTDSTILSRPKIMCLNRQRAEVLVGRRVGYLSTTATETTSTQTVEFLDTGIHLVFRPFISKNGMVRLELQPSVSEASLRNVTDQGGQQVTIPDELTNELTTNVRIKDGQTLVLGGLYREATSMTRRQVPFLGDIPLLGYAFRGQDDIIDRDEIIFLITPSIVHDDTLWEVGEATEEYTSGVMVGARKGLLKFGRSHQIEQHNNRAVAAYNRGDLDMALYHANNSLRLFSGQPEMVRFRQQITGAEEVPFEHSIMRRAFDRELDRVSARDPESMTVSAAATESWDMNSMNQDGMMQAAEDGSMDESQRQRITDFLVHEYFVAAGLEEFSPFLEAPAEPMPGVVDTETAVVGAENESTPDDF